MAPIKSRPIRGLTPSNWANKLTPETEDALEQRLLTEGQRISTYLGFECPELYHDNQPTVYDFATGYVYLNRSWKENCAVQLRIAMPSEDDIEHFACYSLAHELAHRFQHQFVQYEDLERAPELFEGHADLVAAHVYRDRFKLSQESARFLVPAASSLQVETGSAKHEYPPGCVRAFCVAKGMISLAFPAQDGALMQPEQFFASSMIAAFELVVAAEWECQLGRGPCIGCRQEDLPRSTLAFDYPDFQDPSQGASKLIEYYEETVA